VFALLLFTVWSASVGAFAGASAAVAFRAGKQRQPSSVRNNMLVTYRLLPRIMAANFLFWMILVWPIVLAIVLLFAVVLGGSSSALPLILMPLLFIGGCVWFLIAMLRFALVPYVALFEPDVPVLRTLARSHQLLLRGGQWFLVKGFLFMTGVLLVLSAIAGTSLQEVNQSSNVLINFLLVIVSLVANGVLVMLYLNRKQVRG
jgi:hypothetical protein